ncbi:MAG: UPF0280 family protein [Actinomycetota bacterium]|nr:UPF0280 family protein [Actinomycetota bacterium]
MEHNVGNVVEKELMMQSSEKHVLRAYRSVMNPRGLECYSCRIEESDLFICTDKNMRELARDSLSHIRAELEDYLGKHPHFGISFKPVPATENAPLIVQDMAEAAFVFEVGPMASVAGAVAQHVGLNLLKVSKQVIVENGGDIFMAGDRKRKVRIFAGKPSQTVDIIINDEVDGIGLCTSSATVGPSISLGDAEAVTVLAKTATLADAAATAIGNMIHSPDDMEAAIEYARKFPQIRGVVIIIHGSIGAWGEIEFL